MDGERDKAWDENAAAQIAERMRFYERLLDDGSITSMEIAVIENMNEPPDHTLT